MNSGASTAERALHRAVRRLERDGVSVVQYRDAAGNLTVRNRVDVAVRRHVRTQIAQDGARMTARAMDEYGVQLVEVSSHPNARPSHAAWQGQVYGWRGAVSIDGRSYEGLEAATGYGSVDGLLGANCRHSFGPYRAPTSATPSTPAACRARRSTDWSRGSAPGSAPSGRPSASWQAHASATTSPPPTPRASRS